jgi:hypothetical protein
MAKNQLDGVAQFAASNPELFAQSYFSTLIAQGQKPDHGYPENHLPEVAVGATMEMVVAYTA